MIISNQVGPFDSQAEEHESVVMADMPGMVG